MPDSRPPALVLCVVTLQVEPWNVVVLQNRLGRCDQTSSQGRPQAELLGFFKGTSVARQTLARRNPRGGPSGGFVYQLQPVVREDGAQRSPGQGKVPLWGLGFLGSL